jgi:hypothetical protein
VRKKLEGVEEESGVEEQESGTGGEASRWGRRPIPGGHTLPL